MYNGPSLGMRPTEKKHCSADDMLYVTKEALGKIKFWAVEY